VKKVGTEPFVKLPRGLIQSDAWRAAGINTRRFLDFLFLEHMAHGGKENGRLKAPYRQLEQFNINARFVSEAIAEAEKLGLVDCHRGGMRVATTYTLNWLPLSDGTEPIERWRNYKTMDARLPNGHAQLHKDYKSALQREGRAALQREGR
jgi:hypothetical protein